MDDFGWIFAIIAIMGGLAKLLGNSNKSKARPKMKRPQAFKVDSDRQSETAGSGPDFNRDFESMNDEPDLSMSRSYGANKSYARETVVPYERENAEPYLRENAAPYKRITPSPYKKSRKNGSNPFRHLTKEQLREGIILAEVLSEKPRAKNPHPAAHRYRRMKS